MTIGQKIVEAAAKRLVPSGSTEDHRPDLYLADFQKIASDTCRALVGWGDTGEVPSTVALENWVTATFEGSVQLDHRTLRYFPERRALSVIMGWTKQTMPLDEYKRMARVSPTRYLEAETKAIWEVRSDSDGNRFLQRMAKDNLDVLLEERRKRTLGNRTASFSTLPDGGQIDVGEGDEVRFYDRGLTKVGKVVRIDGDHLVVQAGSETCRVAASAVSELVQKDPKVIQDYKDRVMDYWRKILPKEYVSKWEQAGKSA